MIIPETCGEAFAPAQLSAIRRSGEHIPVSCLVLLNDNLLWILSVCPIDQLPPL